MSFNRENVIWKTRDGTWSRGFFTVSWEDPDGDPEWDVEYDYSSFDWASTGHSSEEAAHRSWDGANPGGCDQYSEPSETTDRYDEMAAACIERYRLRYRW